MPTSITPSSPSPPTAHANKPNKKPCPLCNRVLAKKYTWRGVLYAVVCFPCGFYFCLRRRTLRCKACKFEVFYQHTEVLKTAESFQCYEDMGWQLFRSHSTNANTTNYALSPIENANGTVTTTVDKDSTGTKVTDPETSLTEKDPTRAVVVICDPNGAV